ncbi:MAG: amino acid adenylation domain-containing protein, partial [Oscillospiraceae bacterium]|nr:amino acid adenylation domain-containing protein [Oscillospiraceae bacterium]
YAKDKCIHQLFEEQVERIPDKVALVASDKKLTYRKLNEEANRIAHSLIEKGVGKGDIVGLMLPRKSYLLSALFGILKTGAAYLPIDMELPKERIEYMCKDTNAKLVVSEENITSLLNTDNTSNPDVNISNDSLCYCIYTSGSTGQPKAVMARHRNVVNYISKNEHNIFGKIIKEDFEAIVSISTCSFDIFVTETIATLVNGLRVVLADEQECRNQYALNRLLTREKGQFLQTTPTKLKALTKEPNQREFLKNVKAILLGGEAMEQSYLDELKELTEAKIYNIYGVTEVPIWSAFADTDTFKDEITIGHGIANTQMYVLDKYLNPTPIGVMGELCIAGDSVSMGYLNNPELTAEKFVDNPFGNGKLYKTGDHAYWREDGNLVFIGRKDFQVKIRGLRIELGEIESAIQTIDGIERAVVVVRKDKEDRQLLCAFYTGTEINAKDFRIILSSKLPKYMVPHIFTHLDKMPMTASGKANRNALPEIDLENISTETEYVASVTNEETILTNAIESVLRIEKVSTLHNFF